MRVRALLAAPTIMLAVAARTSATAGEERAGRIAWSQFIDKDFNGERIVSARPDGSGLGRRTDPSPGTLAISPDSSQVVVDRRQSACLLEQHPWGASCAY
jgi:hypothetical protein